MLILTAVAFILRLAFAAYVQPVPYTDFKDYWDIAIRLAHGEGYVGYGRAYVQQGAPSAFRPIGYPFLLSLVIRLFGESWWVAVLFQIGMGTGVVLATYWLTARLFGRTAGWIAGVLTALMADHVMWSSVLGSEIPFALVTLLGVTLWVPKVRGGADRRSPNADGPMVPSWQRLFLSGMLLGLATLIRPVLLPVAGLYFTYACLCNWGRLRSRAVMRRVVTGTLVLSLGMMLVIAPWTARNYVVLGAFVPVSTNGGVNLWQGNNPRANGEYYWSWDPTVNPLLTAKTEVERDRLGRRLALAWILDNPDAFLRLGLKKWWYLFRLHSAPYFTIGQAARPLPQWFREGVYRWMWFGLFLVMSLTAVGAAVWLVRFRFHDGSLGRTSLPILFILYMLAIHFVFPAWDRFRFPFTPFMLALAGLAGDYILENLRAVRNPPVTHAIGAHGRSPRG